MLGRLIQYFAMFLTYRYRLLPTKRQHRALESILESQRQLYNAALEERIEAYRKANITRSYMDQAKALTEWRRGDPEARAIPANVQRATLIRLDRAYSSFFRRVRAGANPGFPRFRGKGWFDSFGFAEFAGITFRNGNLRFKGMPGAMRVHLHRLLPAEQDIRTCVFRRDVKGWIVGFDVEVGIAPLRNSGRAVGVDLGLTTFATLSDGAVIPSLRAARMAERRMIRAERAVTRKRRGSKTRGKAVARLRRCHAAVVRRRNDHLHQASTRMIRDYDLIAVEALNFRGLASGRLAKDVRDASWAKFISLLRYKAARAGVRLAEVDPRCTSQECSRCGALVQKTLDDRWHECPHCRLSIDRDLNAARNILDRAGVGPGLRNIVDCGMRAS